MPTLLWTVGIAIAAASWAASCWRSPGSSDNHGSRRPRQGHRPASASTSAACVLALGMVVPFVLALLAAAHFWIANAMYLPPLAAMIGTAVKLVAYRRGL